MKALLKIGGNPKPLQVVQAKMDPLPPGLKVGTPAYYTWRQEQMRKHGMVLYKPLSAESSSERACD